MLFCQGLAFDWAAQQATDTVTDGEFRQVLRARLALGDTGALEGSSGRAPRLFERG